MGTPSVERHDVLRFRLHRHQLHRQPGTAGDSTDVGLLDYGVQDTGPDGAAWALAIRGWASTSPHDLALAWTVRGAPHAYRRSDLAAVEVATAPLSEPTRPSASSTRPSRSSSGHPDIGRAAVRRRSSAGHRHHADGQGEVSGRLTEMLDEPYLRVCRPCGTTHAYEMPFRLAALQAGLDLEAGTSPQCSAGSPDGARSPTRPAGDAEARFDVGIEQVPAPRHHQLTSRRRPLPSMLVLGSGWR